MAIIEIPVPILVLVCCYVVLFFCLLGEFLVSKGIRARARKHPARYALYVLGVLWLGGFVYAKDSPPAPPTPEAAERLPSVVKLVRGADGKLHLILEKEKVEQSETLENE